MVLAMGEEATNVHHVLEHVDIYKMAIAKHLVTQEPVINYFNYYLTN